MKNSNCVDKFNLVEHIHQIDVLKQFAKRYKGKTIDNIIQQMESISAEMLLIKVGL